MTEYLTVKQFAKKHQAFTEAGLRHLIFMGRISGFDQYILRCGRKILLKESAVWQWLEQKNNRL